jgi:3-methylcrotonyl-CoA carboxylase alpha subunit
MGAAAVRLARGAGYVNAGTVEYLFGDDQYYFLEMNTRIQVEHPVTEMVTGLDLIRLQLEIAAGQPLPLSQLDVRPRGHAIEVRLYAEDPAHQFLPVTGTVSLFEPSEGPGVRNDEGVSAGSEVSTYYDCMLAKLVVRAGDREAAVARLRRALKEYSVLGLTTNLALLAWIAGHPEFEQARTDTSWLDRMWPEEGLRREEARPPMEVLVGAALHQAVSTGASGKDEDPHNPWRRASGWRGLGLVSTHRFCVEGEDYEVELARVTGLEWLARVDGDELAVRRLGSTSTHLALGINGRIVRLDVADGGGCIWVGFEGGAYVLTRAGGSSARVGRSPGGAGHASTRDAPTAPMPGTVVKVAVTEGQTVDAHEPLLVLEAMKMEHVVEAPHAGVVKAILFAEGDLVPAGAPLVELEET